MDPSALIFVALAVAWAVYLIPKALEHHEEGLRSRTVSTFSHTVRVLARREPVDRRKARLVTSAAAATKRPQVDVGLADPIVPDADLDGLEATAVLPPLTDIAAVLNPPPRRESPASIRRRAAARAARRRRRVLITLLALVVAGGALDYLGIVSRFVAGVPVVLVVGWLVACRLMVRREHGVRARIPVIIDDPAESEPVAEPERGESAASPLVAEAPVVTGSWDPVDVPLPTYVSKPPAAPRTVRTLDLDETGVWSSGRNAADSALAREADAVRAAEADQALDRAEHERRRAAGS